MYLLENKFYTWKNIAFEKKIAFSYTFFFLTSKGLEYICNFLCTFNP
jgi:hypothetical protein